VDANVDGCITQTEFDAFTAGDQNMPNWGDIEDGMTNDDCLNRNEFADSFGGGDGGGGPGDGPPAFAAMAGDGACISQNDWETATADVSTACDWYNFPQDMTEDDCVDEDEWDDFMDNDLCGNDDGGGDMDIPLEALCSVCGVKMMQAMSVFEELGALPPPRNHTHTHTHTRTYIDNPRNHTDSPLDSLLTCATRSPNRSGRSIPC